MVLAKVTEDHIARAKRMIGVGLDVQQVSQWLATHEVSKADVGRLRELGLKVCDYVDRCKLYGPADALRDWARQLRQAAEDGGDVDTTPLQP